MTSHESVLIRKSASSYTRHQAVIKTTSVDPESIYDRRTSEVYPLQKKTTKKTTTDKQKYRTWVRLRSLKTSLVPNHTTETVVTTPESSSCCNSKTRHINEYGVISSFSFFSVTCCNMKRRQTSVGCYKLTNMTIKCTSNWNSTTSGDIKYPYRARVFKRTDIKLLETTRSSCTVIYVHSCSFPHSQLWREGLHYKKQIKLQRANHFSSLMLDLTPKYLTFAQLCNSHLQGNVKLIIKLDHSHTNHLLAMIHLI